MTSRWIALSIDASNPLRLPRCWADVLAQCAGRPPLIHVETDGRDPT